MKSSSGAAKLIWMSFKLLGLLGQCTFIAQDIYCTLFSDICSTIRLSQDISGIACSNVAFGRKSADISKDVCCWSLAHATQISQPAGVPIDSTDATSAEQRPSIRSL